MTKRLIEQIHREIDAIQVGKPLRVARGTCSLMEKAALRGAR